MQPNNGTTSAMTREPITVTEAARTLLLAVLAVVQVFDWITLTPEQNGAVLGLFAAVSVMLSVLARQRSTPTTQVALTTAQADALTNSPPGN